MASKGPLIRQLGAFARQMSASEVFNGLQLAQVVATQ